MATRHKEFASLCRKVIAMKAKVHEKHKAADGRPIPEESSVGTVASPDAGTPVAGTGDDLATAI